MANSLLFEVSTPLGFIVRVPSSVWELIVTTKHPSMRGREARVKKALQSPDEIRKSRSDESVFLFYLHERPERWICAVAKRVNDDGFLITTYMTDAIKEGERVWEK